MEGQITQWSKDIKGSLCCLSLHLHLLIASLISFDHCVICPSIYRFWLPLWYLLVIVLSVPPFTPSDCPFDIFWSLCYLSLHLQLLIAPLICFGHCVICPSIYSFWLPLWYCLVIVLSVPPHNDQTISKGQSEAVNGGTDNTMTKKYQRGNQKL
jgi:hypothetical protein